jgi:hypothetical protein
VPGVVGDLLEAFGPVVPAAGEYGDGFVGEMHLDAIPVELDLMNPALAGWHAVDRGRRRGLSALAPSASGFLRWKAIATPGAD